MAALSEYLWIAIAGGILAFCYGFLIGANDVANAFASSVSSKSLTLKQAVLVASVCEFSGALFLGARVTGTIRSKIIDIKLYKEEPDVLMFGMFTALLTASIMLFIATAFGLPVSTTHDIVGCIMGFSIAAKGFDSVEWDVAKKLFMSWLASPLISGAVAFVFFFLVKTFVLEAQDPFKRAYYTFPLVITIGVGIDLFYILYKGANNTKFSEKVSVKAVVPICFAVGFACGLVWIFVIGPWAKDRIDNRVQDADAAKAEAEVQAEEITKELPEAMVDDDEEIFVDEYSDTVDKPKVVPPIATKSVEPSKVVQPEQAALATQAPKGLLGRLNDHVFHQDLEGQSMHENAGAAKIWENGVVYNTKAEYLFNYVQVFTACLNSFAHGANDVSNTIAPFSAIIYLYKNGKTQSKSEVDLWVLAFGGGAIVIGLLLYV